MAVTLTMLFGTIGFSVDLGWGYYRKQAAKAAADAAVLAAVAYASANGPACGGTILCSSYSCANLNTSGNALYTACQYAAANGFTDGQNGQSVTVSANSGSPASAPGTSAAFWVSATVSETENTLFAGLAGMRSTTVGAQSTAGIVSTGSASNPCMYILSPSAPDAFQIGNGANVKTSSCGIYVNSNAQPTAMLVTGGATVTSSQIDVVGGFTKNNGGSTSSTPVTGVSAVTDPFLGLPSPTPSGTCTAGNFTNWQAQPYQVQPGTYCNGFNLGNGMGAVMAPGVYIISGGSFNIQSGPLTATGGVTIYLTGTATVNIANGSTVTLSAQSSGSYEGILFYQDRSVSSPGASTFAGGANMNLSGSLYFPKALLNINNGTNTQTGAVVASTVNFQGGASFKAGTQAQTGINSSPTYTPYLLQ
jgi:hypothetical protein